MTSKTDPADYDTYHVTLDDASNDKLDSLADNHHNGNRSEAIRASIRFRSRWSNRNKSLPKEIIRLLGQILSSLHNLSGQVDHLAEQVTDVELTASDVPKAKADRAKHKREVLHALSKTQPRRIDDVAEDVELQLSDAAAAAEELEDNGLIMRTTTDEEEVRFKKLK